ncbi:transcription initiation factor IID, 18kD subunit-domain-containing protein [Russula brevipes]|nr:transcription initiation factor IID, 18kD subunit-domain-containing protein [Russula brevipes]
MAYYTPQTGQHPTASGAYPYSTYPYTHPQTAGAYPYTAGAHPGTAVTGYGAAWPYSYSYYQHHHTSALPKPATTQPTVTAGTAALPANAQRTTFTAYTPTYSRDSAGAGVAGGPSSRAYKKQSNFKGLFAKELRNLMFGFGDDRNPSNDTVNVMEEILVEYIADICQTALAPTKKSRLSIEDFRRALSRPADAKKLARMEELLAQFNDSEMNQSKGLPP